MTTEALLSYAYTWKVREGRFRGTNNIDKLIRCLKCMKWYYSIFDIG